MSRIFAVVVQPRWNKPPIPTTGVESKCDDAAAEGVSDVTLLSSPASCCAGPAFPEFIWIVCSFLSQSLLSLWVSGRVPGLGKIDVDVYLAPRFPLWTPHKRKKQMKSRPVELIEKVEAKKTVCSTLYNRGLNMLSSEDLPSRDVRQCGTLKLFGNLKSDQFRTDHKTRTDFPTPRRPEGVTPRYLGLTIIRVRSQSSWKRWFCFKQLTSVCCQRNVTKDNNSLY